MSDVFADTSFFVALLHAGDRHHARAHEFALSRAERLVTTAWVIAELGNFLRNQRGGRHSSVCGRGCSKMRRRR